ncbi:MAG TPA: hypothetical protein VGA40_05980, partial [Candidatus Acidoferrales bacterium]
MADSFCEVALPVPLRTTFTYAIPAALAGEVIPGMRVLAPFRNRAMVGVVMETSAHAPEGAAKQKLRDIQEVLDAQPALTPALVELALWMARYYVAPIGEVVRAMLPPAVDVRQQRYLHLTG